MKTPLGSDDRGPRTGLRRMTAALLLGTALIGVPVGAVLTFDRPAVAQNQAEAPTSIVPAAPGSFAGLVRQVIPAVVNVSTTEHPSAAQMADEDEGGGRMRQFPPGSPFDEFFKRFFDEQQPGRRGPRGGGGGGDSDQVIHGAGSGFIIDPAGYIVTNNHVVKDADNITVTLNDGTVIPAKVVGTDEKTDLALLKVDTDKKLTAVEWGDSDAAQVGDWVIAVGNPFGLGGSVTAGIVSARGRDLHSGPFDDFLQIDAPINRGNSGGPSFDISGKVIGINSAIYSPSGGSVGIGFAIPSNLAKTVIAQIREHGSVQRGWLGVQIQQVTPEMADALGLDKARGALVADVQDDSPALKAGLHQGDVITSYDGKPVNQLSDLPRLVADTAAGKTVPVEVMRNGKTETISVDIAKLPDSQQVASAEESGPAVDDQLGLSLSALTPKVRREYSVPDDVEGVLVTGIREDGPARETGVGPGDVIVRVGSEAVKTPSEVAKQVKAAKEADRNAVMLLINRQGDQRFVALKLPKA
ncbi:DegQ family serine endoprotease [Inquilinus limosus]|uniref:DegQ family serine endoprotease n=1 Tax=Inquilinus limosus TaxID=171674 RepID=UPI00047C7718|nr:DegQ family serine endoprotease [Inquilinus limosus]